MIYLLSIFISVFGMALPVFAQADYRNLDSGRPIAIEDAQPIEFRTWEFQLGLPRETRLRSGGMNSRWSLN